MRAFSNPVPCRGRAAAAARALSGLGAIVCLQRAIGARARRRRRWRGPRGGLRSRRAARGRARTGQTSLTSEMRIDGRARPDSLVRVPLLSGRRSDEPPLPGPTTAPGPAAPRSSRDRGVGIIRNEAGDTPEDFILANARAPAAHRAPPAPVLPPVASARRLEARPAPTHALPGNRSRHERAGQRTSAVVASPPKGDAPLRGKHRYRPST
jgi:hypothetical protein